jgi:hypothetical protein
MLVADNWLPKELYEKMISDESFFPESMGGGDRIATELNSYHYEQSTCFAPYMFWDGWLNSPANTLKKQIIQNIWENNLPFPIEEVLGFEYWTRTYLPGQYLDTHVDEDTFMYEDHKVFSGPAIGAILYGIDNSDGGFLELHKSILIDGTKNALEREKISDMLSPIEERERIAYRGNRLVIFDAGHQIHATSPAKSGIRQVMVINVWHRDVPPTAIKKNSFFYE